MRHDSAAARAVTHPSRSTPSAANKLNHFSATPQIAAKKVTRLFCSPDFREDKPRVPWLHTHPKSRHPRVGGPGQLGIDFKSSTISITHSCR